MTEILPNPPGQGARAHFVDTEPVDQGKKIRDEIATVLLIYDKLEALVPTQRVRVLKYVEQLLGDSL